MKNVGTVNHLYFYVNGMLLMEYRYNAMGDTTDVLQYFYDANGKPHAMAYNGTVYLYVTNLQGDIVALLGLDGTVSGYEYDPYGNVIASYGDIAAINPLRYRGYYYDNETGLYYLQSRYYDPVVGRFINADDISNLAGNSGFASYNLFAYCGNSPVTRKDEGGTLWNYVIGAVVGGTVSAITAARQTYVEEGSINWAKTIISGTVGAVSGGIAASGLSWIAQAGYTSLTAAVGDIGVQITDVVTKKKPYNVKQTIHNSILAGGSSVVGSALGAITSYGKSTISSELLESASKKASTAVVRNSIGKSSSKLARQAQRHFAEGIKQQNIARGISSVTGTVLTWGATTRYTY